MTPLHRTTDYGTVVLHVMLVASFALLVATGLRIAGDDPGSEWLRMLDPVLPVEHLWYRHMVAGVVMIAVLAGYVIYVRRARLQSRVRLDRTRLLVMLQPGRQRWAAFNVAVYWILMGALGVEVATGLMMFSGAAQTVTAIHRITTYVAVGSVVAHVALHARFGGLGQLLRVLRPVPLHLAEPPKDLAELLAEQLAKQHQAAEAPASDAAKTESQEPPPLPPQRKGEHTSPTTTLHAHPLATAVVVALAAAGALLGAEQTTRPTVRISQIPRAQAPVLDGDLSDPAWTKALPVSVLTTQGGDFGGTHQASVEVRAVHDGEFAYFAFVWDDPTRSLKHLPLVKRGGRWRVAAGRDDLRDENRFHEDKFAVLLASPGLPLIGAAIHLAKQPLADKPGSVSGRGLHYTVGPGIADVWQWRASHGGPTGHVDNSHFGNPAQVEPMAAHYDGGFVPDPGTPPHQSNIADGGAEPAAAWVTPRRLPRDLPAMRMAMGRINDDAAASESETARWWMSHSESVPYAPTADAAIPEGTVIPGVVFDDRAALGRDAIRGVARWAAGRWTLEVARRLYTDSAFDIAIKTGTLMWVAAFDHAEKRHTRHLRPLRLEVD